MEFMDVIKKRRSIRNFLPDAVPDEIINDLLEAARLAPSGGNGQGWSFGVIKDPDLKSQLAEAAGEQSWIATAPVIIACCAKMEEDKAQLPKDDFGLIVDNIRFGEELVSYMNNYEDRKMANIFWCNSTPLIPGEHIALAAVNYGLSSCWIGYLDVVKASEILNLPEDYVCLFLLPIGYTNEELEDVDKKKLEEVVFYDKYSCENK